MLAMHLLIITLMHGFHVNKRQTSSKIFLWRREQQVVVAQDWILTICSAGEICPASLFYKSMVVNEKRWFVYISLREILKFNKIVPDYSQRPWHPWNQKKRDKFRNWRSKSRKWTQTIIVVNDWSALQTV